MNVTPSKIVLGLSLGAFAFGTWDHIFPDKVASTRAEKGKELTAGTVNRTVALKLERDPFNSVPLDQGSIHVDAALPNEAGKELGDLTLQGVMITFAERAAVVNGKALHEGESMQTSTGATIRAKKIGVGYCIVEGAGRIVMLRVEDSADPSKKDQAKGDDKANSTGSSKPDSKAEAKKSGGGGGAKTAVAGTNPNQR